jgi:hypothetical protein
MQVFGIFGRMYGGVFTKAHLSALNLYIVTVNNKYLGFFLGDSDAFGSIVIYDPY